MKKKIVIFLVLGLLILGGGGASAYFFILKDNGPDPVALEGSEGAGITEPAIEDLPPALYYNLPSLVVSANYQGRLRYLQVKLSVMTRNEDSLELLQDNTPLLQDSLILLLGSYEFTHLETTEGKEELRQKAQEKINELIGAGSIESVLFTGFVIQ